MQDTKPRESKTQEQRLKEYHEHLDSCYRCREEPFNPCEKGVELLLATGIERLR